MQGYPQPPPPGYAPQPVYAPPPGGYAPPPGGYAPVPYPQYGPQYGPQPPPGYGGPYQQPPPPPRQEGMGCLQKFCVICGSCAGLFACLQCLGGTQSCQDAMDGDRYGGGGGGPGAGVQPPGVPGAPTPGADQHQDTPDDDHGQEDYHDDSGGHDD